MRQFPVISLVLWFLLCAVAANITAVAQESDFEKFERFQKTYDALMKELGAATSVEQTMKIEEKIAAFESESAMNKTLFDKSLYPETYDNKMLALRDQLELLKAKLGIIETSLQRIAELEEQVAKLSEQVETLTKENATLFEKVGQLDAQLTSLRRQREENESKIDSLTQLVAQLRSNLLERDNLIFAMVDSIFLQMGKDVQTFTEVDRKKAESKLSGQNVLLRLRTAVDENLKFLDVTALSGKDYERLFVEQEQFKSKWSGLGSKLASVYVKSDKKRAAEIAAVDTMIEVWKKKLDASMWTNIEKLFLDHDIRMTQFSDAASFNASVVTFVNSELDMVQKQKSDERTAVFDNFVNKVWEPSIVPEWKQTLLTRGGMTEEQFAEMQDKVDEWKGHFGAPWWYYVIAAIVVLLIIYFVVKGGKKKPTAAPAP